MKIFGRYPEDDLVSVVESSGDLFNSLYSCNFIVLGASGFLGSWISTYLTFLQFHGLLDGTITLVARDVNKLSELDGILQNRKSKLLSTSTIERDKFSHLNTNRIVVFFAATDSSMYGNTITDSKDASLQIAQQTIDSLLPSDITFIHLSSGGVYNQSARKLNGIPSSFPTAESTNDNYIYQKLSLENWSVNESQRGMFKARNPRLFSFYGPGLQLDRHFAIAEFMNRAIVKLPIVIRGNPSNLRTYLHPRDAITQLMQQALPEEPAYKQIGSAIPRSIQDVGRTIAEEFNVPLLFTEGGSVEINNYVPLNVPLLREKDFLKGIQDWHEWIKQNQARNI